MKKNEEQLNFNKWMKEHMISTMWVEDTYEKRRFMERLRDTHTPIRNQQNKIYG
jgi:hypothetical protein